MLPHNWLHATLPQTLERGEQVDVPRSGEGRFY